MNKAFTTYNSNKAGLIALGLYTGMSEAQVKSEIAKLKILYPCVPNANSLFSSYNVSGTPRAILISPQKKVVEKAMDYSEVCEVIKKYKIATTAVVSMHDQHARFLFTVSDNNLSFTPALSDRYSIATFSFDGKLISTQARSFTGQTTYSIPLSSMIKSSGAYIIQVNGSHEKGVRAITFNR